MTSHADIRKLSGINYRPAMTFTESIVVESTGSDIDVLLPLVVDIAANPELIAGVTKIIKKALSDINELRQSIDDSPMTESSKTAKEFDKALKKVQALMVKNEPTTSDKMMKALVELNAAKLNHFELDGVGSI